jgi:non-specific serine/threonine protein kinase
LQADHEAAERYFAESLVLWRALGDTTRVAAAVGNLGQVAQNQNAVDHALICYRESLELYESIHDVRGVAVALGRVALLERQQGRTGEAGVLLERSVAQFREVGDAAGLANSLANLGHTALLRGDLDRADACFTESLQLRRGLGNVLGAAECLEGFAALASAQGRSRRAARLCGAAEAVREHAGTPLVPADRVTHDRLVATISSRLGEHTFTNEWATGRATPFDEAARYALRSASDAREPTVTPGAQTHAPLTRREREVVALVARGLTNRQVADRLLVAPRTIETHLEHVFAKLGVQTRAEVAAWAARADALQTTSARTVNRVARPVLQ